MYVNFHPNLFAFGIVNRPTRVRTPSFWVIVDFTNQPPFCVMQYINTSNLSFRRVKCNKCPLTFIGLV